MGSSETAAESVLALEYGNVKAEILRTVSAKLAADGLSVAEIDLEASYNEAWHAIYLKLDAGEEITNRKGLLVTITYRRALSEVRASRPGRRGEAERLERTVSNTDLDAQLDAEMQLRQFVEGLRSRLSPRELEAAILCYLHGFSRADAADAMGISPRRMEKVMDGATRKIQSVIEQVKSGEHCDQFDSMIRAYAVGLLDTEGERYELASDHLQGCSACRRKVMVLRGLASISPPIPALIGLAAAASAAGAGGSVGGGSSAGASAAKSAAANGSRTARIAGTTAAVAAVAAVATAVVVISSEDGSSPSQTPPGGGITVQSPSARPGGGGGEVSEREARSLRRAKAVAKQRAAAKRRAERREAESIPPVPAPVVVPDPVVETPQPPTVPDPVTAQPPPAADPEPEVPRKPITDAGVEFELR